MSVMCDQKQLLSAVRINLQGMTPFNKQLDTMRAYYLTGATHSLAFRRQQLRTLRSVILKYEKEIQQALFADLRKSAEETWVTETGFVLAEINAILKHLPQWMRPE